MLLARFVGELSARSQMYHCENTSIPHVSSDRKRDIEKKRNVRERHSLPIARFVAELGIILVMDHCDNKSLRPGFSAPYKREVLDCVTVQKSHYFGNLTLCWRGSVASPGEGN